MTPATSSLLLTVFLAILVAISDYFLKHASESSSPFFNRYFFVGLGFSVLITFGWVLVMPHLKLAYIGVIYSLTVVLSLCLVGALFFDEQLKPSEWLGVGLAITSMVLLYQRLG